MPIKPGSDSYTIQKNDSLSKVAGSLLQTDATAKAYYRNQLNFATDALFAHNRMNKQAVQDKNTILPNQKLNIDIPGSTAELKKVTSITLRKRFQEGLSRPGFRERLIDALSEKQYWGLWALAPAQDMVKATSDAQIAELLCSTSGPYLIQRNMLDKHVPNQRREAIDTLLARCQKPTAQKLIQTTMTPTVSAEDKKGIAQLNRLAASPQVSAYPELIQMWNALPPATQARIFPTLLPHTKNRVQEANYASIATRLNRHANNGQFQSMFTYLEQIGEKVQRAVSARLNPNVQRALRRPAVALQAEDLNDTAKRSQQEAFEKEWSALTQTMQCDVWPFLSSKAKRYADNIAKQAQKDKQLAQSRKAQPDRSTAGKLPAKTPGGHPLHLTDTSQAAFNQFFKYTKNDACTFCDLGPQKNELSRTDSMRLMELLNDTYSMLAKDPSKHAILDAVYHDEYTITSTLRTMQKQACLMADNIAESKSNPGYGPYYDHLQNYYQGKITFDQLKQALHTSASKFDWAKHPEPQGNTATKTWIYQWLWEAQQKGKIQPSNHVAKNDGKTAADIWANKDTPQRYRFLQEMYRLTHKECKYNITGLDETKEGKNKKSRSCYHFTFH